MPRRKRDDTNNNKSGRNCYTRDVSSERLEKAQKRLQCLIDLKTSLEDNLEKTLIQIENISAKIAELECKMEKMMKNFEANDCVNRMKAEIMTIKEERARAEQEVNRYKAKITNELKKLEKCRKSFKSYGRNKEDNNNNDECA